MSAHTYAPVCLSVCLFSSLKTQNTTAKQSELRFNRLQRGQEVSKQISLITAGNSPPPPPKKKHLLTDGLCS